MSINEPDDEPDDELDREPPDELDGKTARNSTEWEGSCLRALAGLSWLDEALALCLQRLSGGDKAKSMRMMSPSTRSREARLVFRGGSVSHQDSALQAVVPSITAKKQYLAMVTRMGDHRASMFNGWVSGLKDEVRQGMPASSG
jgi:hypothetical protein